MPATGNLQYEFCTPGRIHFGWGRRREVGKMAAGLGRRAFIVSGSRTLEANGLIDEIAGLLRAAGVEPLRAATISREPEVEDVDRAVAALRAMDASGNDLVLAVGGGSAIDLGKAAAGLAGQPESNSVRDYLEGVGRGLEISQPVIPLLAMPTTGGTGSEATRNAVISCYDPPFKKSLRSERLLPRMVLVDPELSVSLPPEVTAWTGMDAITQLIESYISRKAQPLTQALALAGLEMAAPAIVEAVGDGASRPARENMAQAALLSGMALANSGLGMAHGVAAALGVHCKVPHGLACAVMLPAALRTNLQVSQQPLARLASALTGEHYASVPAAAQATVDAVQQLCDAVHVPRRLSQIGVKPEQIPDLVQSSRGNSMSGNPSDISDERLSAILHSML